jgi:putative transposase
LEITHLNIKNIGRPQKISKYRKNCRTRQSPNNSEGDIRLGKEKRPRQAASPKASSPLTSSTLNEPPVPLLPFRGGERLNAPEAGIPFTFADYLALTDWTGRAIRADKRGFIPAEVPPILKRLGIEENAWVETVRDYGRRFCRGVGSAEQLRRLARRWGHRWLWGLKPSSALYLRPETACSQQAE